MLQHRWKLELERLMTGQETLVLLGPVSAMAGRTRGLFRDHILLKADDRTHLSHALRTSVACLEEEYRTAGLKFVVDVDPVDMF
jgi:primosomal protein N'